MSAVTSTAVQSNRPTSGMWFTIQWNGLIVTSGPPISSPLATHSSSIASALIPAAPPRPSSGASANASPPKNRASAPTHAAKPTDSSSEIWSPMATSPNAFELTTSMTARIASASPTMVRCAASFSRAIRRLPNGDEATKSRLPRADSPASVPVSAMTDHRAVPTANSAPYLKVSQPPRVPSEAPIRVALPNRLTISGGMPLTRAPRSARASGEGNTVPIAVPITSASPPNMPAAMMNESRESRIVLP